MKSFSKDLTIGDTVYTAKFSGSEFSFFIDTKKSKNVFKFVDTKSLDFMMGHIDLEDEIYLKPNTGIKEIFKLKKFVLDFIGDIISTISPYYFEYSANQKMKIPIYRMIGQKIARTYGYTMSEKPLTKSYIVFLFSKS